VAGPFCKPLQELIFSMRATIPREVGCATLDTKEKSAAPFITCP
jgi:hypothetical protein